MESAAAVPITVDTIVATVATISEFFTARMTS